MLEKGSYVPWASHFMSYIDGKKAYEKMLKDAITNGPYQMKEMNDPGNLTDIDAMNLILLGILNYIYNTVDACKTTQAMWNRVRRLIQGTDLSKQERDSRLSNEFDKFTYVDGESIELVYEFFSRLMNDMDRHEVLPNQIAINKKFLNSLWPDWSKYVTMIRIMHNLHSVEYDLLHDFLKQNEVNVNASKAKRVVKAHDPLVLVANTYTSASHSRSSTAYYVTHPPSMSDLYDETQSYAYQGNTQCDDQEDTLTTAMMLLARAITQHYSTPTKIHLRTFSNTRNQAYVQDGRVDVQTKNVGNVGSAGRNTGHNVRSSWTASYFQKTNGNIEIVKRVLMTIANSGQTPTI
ncbi:hypothetical protein Tco_1086856 [Tanacetum coccineum]